MKPEKDERTVQLLEMVLTANPRTSEALALCFAIIFLKYKKFRGAPLPTIMVLAQALSVSKKIAEKALRELQKKYRIVKSKTTMGSLFITELTSNLELYITSTISGLTHSEPVLTLNDYTMGKLPYISEGFEKSYHLALDASRNHGCVEVDVKDIPRLDEVTRQILSARFNREFCANETLYTGKYQPILNLLLDKTGHNGEIVILKPDSDSDMNNGDNQVRIADLISHRAHEVKISALDDFCKQKKVGVVYFVPPLSFGFKEAAAESVFKRLIDLRSEHEFQIIFHDRNLSYRSVDRSVPNRAYEEVFEFLGTEKNTFLYYIGPLCTLTPKLAQVNGVIGPCKRLTTLNNKHIWHKEVVNAVAGYALVYLYENGELEKAEKIVAKAAIVRAQQAQEILLAYDLFKEEHLLNSEGWLLCLELKEGVFPADTDEQLMALNVAIFEKNWSWPVYKPEGGIIISISDFESSSDQKLHLHMLVQLITNLI